MQVITKDLINGRKVLLRYDIDVVLHPLEDFKLKAGLKTLRLCIDNATKVIIVGHVGRPFKTAEDEKSGTPKELSAKPIQQWFEKTLGQSVEFAEDLEQASKSTNKIV